MAAPGQPVLPALADAPRAGPSRVEQGWLEWEPRRAEVWVSVVRGRLVSTRHNQANRVEMREPSVQWRGAQDGR